MNTSRILAILNSNATRAEQNNERLKTLLANALTILEEQGFGGESRRGHHAFTNREDGERGGRKQSAPSEDRGQNCGRFRAHRNADCRIHLRHLVVDIERYCYGGELRH